MLDVLGVVDVLVELDEELDEEVEVVVDELVELVGGSVVEVVVVVAEMICSANSVILSRKYVVRVLYPETDKCTPSATKRLWPLGVKNLFQSATTKLGYRRVAF